MEIPPGVQASIAGKTIVIKGPKGELKRDMPSKRIMMEVKENKMILSAKDATKNDKRMIGTFEAHVKNMLRGAVNCHVYRLKICSGHFPINVSYSNNEFVVKNFLGEKIPRILKIKKDVTVKLEGSDVTVESFNKELAGQTAAEIEKLTAIKGRDIRVFQDGIYITEKDGKKIME